MAEEVGLAPEIKDDFLTCRFCHLPFNHPKALPCLHTFCKNCLSLHVLRHAMPAQDGTSCVNCPTCQQLCDLPGGGVEELPDNVLMKSILAVINAKVQQICDPCTDDKMRKPGTFCCTNCEEFMCEPCAITHKRTRGTKEHLVLDIACMKDLCRMVNHDGIERPTINIRLLSKFGKLGHDLHEPIALATNKADDVIVSQGNGTVSLFSNSGECKKIVDQALFLQQQKDEEEEEGDKKQEEGDKKQEEGNKTIPNKGVAITSEGYLAVTMKREMTTTNNNGQTIVVGAQVGMVQSFAGREINVCIVRMKNTEECQPHGIAITNTNHIIISDVGRHCIYVFDPEYKLIQTFGKRGSRGNKQFKHPYYVATNPDRDIIVSDYGNHCVKVFNFKNLKCKVRIGGNGSKPGCFNHPMGVCADRYGNIFVADRDNHRVQMFDPRGQFLAFILQETYEKGEDVRPLDIAMTSNSHLVALLTGVEGVEFSQVGIYQLRASKVQQQQYQLQVQIEEEKRRLEEEKRLEEERKQMEEDEKKREEERQRLEEEQRKREAEKEKSEQEKQRLDLEHKKLDLELTKQKLIMTKTESFADDAGSNKTSPVENRKVEVGSNTPPSSVKVKKPKKNKGSIKKTNDPDNALAPKASEALDLPSLTKRPAVLPPIAGAGSKPVASGKAPTKHIVQPDLVLQSLAESIIFDPDKAEATVKDCAPDKSKKGDKTDKEKDSSKDEPEGEGSATSSDKKKDPSQVCVIL